jgi:hypothetical protein
MLHIKCPSCLHNLDLAEPSGDGPLTCPDCQARFDRQGQPVDPVPAPARDYPVVASSPNRLTPYARDLEEYEGEKQERREERDFRRDVRGFRRDDMTDDREERVEGKERNVLAIVGLALATCAFLLVGGGLLFRLISDARTSTGVYLGLTLFVGFPTAIAALILSLIGLLYRKVMRPLAIIGLILAGVLVFLLIPAGFLILWS